MCGKNCGGCPLPCLSTCGESVLVHRPILPLAYASLPLSRIDPAISPFFLCCSLVHGDLTCNNVLLEGKDNDPRGFVAKVGDFGLSKIVRPHGVAEPESIKTTGFGTVAYMPPELLAEGLLSLKVDVYSFGVLMWQVGAPPCPARALALAARALGPHSAHQPPAAIHRQGPVGGQVGLRADPTRHRRPGRPGLWRRVVGPPGPRLCPAFPRLHEL